MNADYIPDSITLFWYNLLNYTELRFSSEWSQNFNSENIIWTASWYWI